MPSSAAAVGFIKLLLQKCDHVLSLGNIALLTRFVAATQCNHHGEAVLPAVDAITWAAMNAKLDNITTNRLEAYSINFCGYNLARLDQE